MAKVYEIRKIGSQSLFENGFRLARFCGKGNESIALAVTISYLDSLILSQNTINSNFQFLETW